MKTASLYWTRYLIGSDSVVIGTAISMETTLSLAAQSPCGGSWEQWLLSLSSHHVVTVSSRWLMEYEFYCVIINTKYCNVVLFCQLAGSRLKTFARKYNSIMNRLADFCCNWNKSIRLGQKKICCLPFPDRPKNHENLGSRFYLNFILFSFITSNNSEFCQQNIIKKEFILFSYIFEPFK